MRLLFFTILLTCLFAALCSAQIDHGPFPADLNGSNFTYPHPVKVYRFTSQGQTLEMAFVDVASPPNTASAGKTAVLLHGKNFCAATWSDAITALTGAGYRVIAPDQVGFCKSSKPRGYQFSLHQLAANTHGLLGALGIDRPTVVGHSMGGMLAARYGLMYGAETDAIVLVNPLGLEDWKALGVPYPSIDETVTSERASTHESIRAYQQATYYAGSWAAAYDVWVDMLMGVYQGSEREAFAANQALVVDMVLTQPVVYEFGLLKPRTLLMIGEKDTTAIGKQWSPPEVQARLGHYNVLGDQAAAAIPNSTLLKFIDLGHAPQIQDPKDFHATLLKWLRSG